MQTRTMMLIWLATLLLVGGALFGACSGATSPSAPATTDPAPTAVPATVGTTATAVPPGAPDPTAPAVDPPTATAESIQAPATEEAPAIDAAALLEARCVDCHSLSRIMGARYTQEQWQQVVTRMIRHGAVLNPDEETALVAYLAETYKP